MKGLLDRARGSHEAWLLGVILLMVAVLSAIAPGFFSVANFVDLIETYSVQGILALGLFVVLVSGGIDISFMAVASVAQYVAGFLAARWHWAPALVILVGLATGTALGCVNAALIFYLNIISIIATIATMSVFFALLMYLTGGKLISDLPDWWTDRVVFAQWRNADDDLVRITLPIVALAVTALLTWLMMTRSNAGRQIYAMGGNMESARRIGIPIAKLHFLVYGFLGFMAALGGLLQAHRVGEAVPNALYGTELAVLSAAVLGGASLTGGAGSVPGVLCGIVLLAILQNGLNLMGVSPYFFQIVIGLVILVATSVMVLSARRRRPRRAEDAAHG